MRRGQLDSRTRGVFEPGQRRATPDHGEFLLPPSPCLLANVAGHRIGVTKTESSGVRVGRGWRGGKLVGPSKTILPGDVPPLERGCSWERGGVSGGGRIARLERRRTLRCGVAEFPVDDTLHDLVRGYPITVSTQPPHHIDTLCVVQLFFGDPC